MLAHNFCQAGMCLRQASLNLDSNSARFACNITTAVHGTLYACFAVGSEGTIQQEYQLAVAVCLGLYSWLVPVRAHMALTHANIDCLVADAAGM